MKKFLMRLGVGLSAFLVLAAAGVSQVHAAAIDYSSSSAAVSDATSGLAPVLYSNALIVIGIALGIWALFWAVGKLRRHVR